MILGGRDYIHTQTHINTCRHARAHTPTQPDRHKDAKAYMHACPLGYMNPQKINTCVAVT